jgi:hypothetical protein
MSDDNEIQYSQIEQWKDTENCSQVDLNNPLNNGGVKTLNPKLKTNHAIQTDY